MNDILVSVHFLVTVQGYFLFVLLLLRKPRTRAGGWLALFILLVSLETSQMYLLETGNNGHFIGLTQPLWFLFGPVTYHFALCISGRCLAWSPPRFLHFAPFAIIAMYLGIAYYPLDANIKQAALTAYIDGERTFEFAAVNAAAALHLTGYAVLLFRHFFEHRRRGRRFFSNLDKLRIKSIGFIAAVGASGAILQWFNLLYPYLGVDRTTASPVIENSIFMVGSAAVYVMGIYALCRPQYLVSGTLPVLWHDVSQTDTETPDAGVDKTASCKKEITEYMTHHRPYLDSNFTIQELANALKIPSYRVSKTINQEMGANFFQLVNRYRVEEVKRMLDDPSSNHRKLLDIAFEAGFNAKATFNAIFKKHTGMTPTQYRNRPGR